MTTTTEPTTDQVEAAAKQAAVAHEIKLRNTYREGLNELAAGKQMTAKLSDAFYGAGRELGLTPPQIAEDVATLKRITAGHAEIEADKVTLAANHARLAELAPMIRTAEADLAKLKAEYRSTSSTNNMLIAKRQQITSLTAANDRLFGDVQESATRAVEHQILRYRQRNEPMPSHSYRH